MNEIVFEVTQESDGGFVAEAPGESIFTEGHSCEELRENARESVHPVSLTVRRPDQSGCTLLRSHCVKLPRNLAGRQLVHVAREGDE
ncbi:MAG TPA: hypothetical protein VGG69_05260 [Rhizomicrobium sp.]|jgi:hypothetical protein